MRDFGRHIIIFSYPWCCCRDNALPLPTKFLSTRRFRYYEIHCFGHIPCMIRSCNLIRPKFNYSGGFQFSQGTSWITISLRNLAIRADEKSLPYFSTRPSLGTLIWLNYILIIIHFVYRSSSTHSSIFENSQLYFW